MIKLSIILPTYNEKGNIAQLIDEILNSTKGIDSEIIVVDDNSPDGTGKLVEEISKKNNSVKLIIRLKDKGLSNSIKEGIKNAQGENIIVMDSDFSHPPSVIPRLFKSLNEHDMVVASRYVAQGSMVAPWHKYLGSFMLNKSISVILGLKTKDSTGGFFILKKKSLENMDVNKIFKGYGEFSFRLLYSFEKKKKKIKEIPFRYAMRLHGESKTGLLKTGFGYLYEAFKTRLDL